MKNKMLVFLSVCISLCLFIAAGIIVNKKLENKKNEIVKNNSSLIINDTKKVYGQENAKIKLVEFVDPECPFCSSFHFTLKEVVDYYYKDVSIQYRYIDIHSNSKFVMTLLEASKLQDKYLETLGYMYEGQERWTNYKTRNDKLIISYLKENKINLDVDKLIIDSKQIDIEPILKRDRADSRALGVTGTPTLFINNELIDNKYYDAKSLIDIIGIKLIELEQIEK